MSKTEIHERTLQEHCIEVELPLMAKLAPMCRVVGIAIGGGNLKFCRLFGRQLAAVMKQIQRPPLLIISSDTNHFAADEENRRLDEMALQAVNVMEALRFLNQFTGISGIDCATSAEATDDTSRVVGYAGLLLEG